MTTRFLFDSDMFTHYSHQHPAVVRNVVQHLNDELAVSVITVEEVLGGWYTMVRRARRPDQLINAYEHLAGTMRHLRAWDVIGFSAAALARYQHLRALRLRIGTQDLRIAAIALEWGAVVVTRNLGDFGRVPGLVCEDWSA